LNVLLFSTLLEVVLSLLLFDTRAVEFGGTALPGPASRISRLGPETSSYCSKLSLQDTSCLISFNFAHGGGNAVSEAAAVKGRP